MRGRLGFASAGLALLTGGRGEPEELIAAHRRPGPPYGAGDEARAYGATALLDVSDGLVQDLGHIADASGVRVEIDSAAVPVPEILGPDGLRHALTGGEDHAFAGTFPVPRRRPGRGSASWQRVRECAWTDANRRPARGITSPSERRVHERVQPCALTHPVGRFGTGLVYIL